MPNESDREEGKRPLTLRVAVERPHLRTIGLADSLRAVLAGASSANLLVPASALFEAGGKRVLSASTQRAVRHVAERSAARALSIATGPVLESASSLAAKPFVFASAAPVTAAREVARSVGANAVRVAGKELLKGAGKAAGIGFLFDGAVAGFEAVVAVRNGSSDRASAVKHVAKEATTGAVATGAGVLLGAGLVALTGGVAAPVVFAVGAIGSIGAKQLLRRVIG